MPVQLPFLKQPMRVTVRLFLPEHSASGLSSHPTAVEAPEAFQDFGQWIVTRSLSDSLTPGKCKIE
jgi:hypothetical protein